MIIPTLTMEAAARRVWEVAVVGAGPAGAMAALRLARLGRRVLLIDKADFPRWKVCGACLNRAGQAALTSAGLGDLPRRLGAVPLASMVIAAFGRRIELPLPGSLSISREALDAALVEAALAAGVDFLPQTLASAGPATPDWRELRLVHGGASGKKGAIRARVVLAADGLAGRLGAGELGGEWVAPGSRMGAGVVLEGGPDFYRPGTIYMARGRGGYAGLVRLEDGRLNVGAALEPNTVKAQGGLGPAVEAILTETGWPGLAAAAMTISESDNNQDHEHDHEHEHELTNRPRPHAACRTPHLCWRGTPFLTRHLAAPAGFRLLALGDAAGYVEPFTGQGMAWALHQALAIAPLAARAAGAWHVSLEREWTWLYESMTRTPHRACRLVGALLRHERAADAAAALLAAWPGAARPFMRYFCGNPLAQKPLAGKDHDDTNAHPGLGNQPTHSLHPPGARG